jgi:hypothetical protein
MTSFLDTCACGSLEIELVQGRSCASSTSKWRCSDVRDLRMRHEAPAAVRARQRAPHEHEHAHPHDTTNTTATCTCTSSSRATADGSPLEQDVLAKNDRLAARNRACSPRAHIAAFNFTSAPGAGKTALLQA